MPPTSASSCAARSLVACGFDQVAGDEADLAGVGRQPGIDLVGLVPSLTSSISTLAPSRANASHSTTPRPPVPPVTSAVLPLCSMVPILSCSRRAGSTARRCARPRSAASSGRAAARAWYRRRSCRPRCRDRRTGAPRARSPGWRAPRPGCRRGNGGRTRGCRAPTSGAVSSAFERRPSSSSWRGLHSHLASSHASAATGDAFGIAQSGE